uniref:50S ribosomal protein L22, chloroplastic n=16 Tax=Fagaceae TaxID=3503 RepID=A0A5P8HAJ8_9ROSI|nr:ribosomal protein L22 [Quercus sichourensis]YP_010048673.1 ribosomal protein L22 [Quercus acuta]YP_010157514.1 ribosomal protein L22 [Quercus chungii]YP_010224587.1 ribosomal protein L22 [Cyclobalanopsis edithae]YP_010251855.1 ribosomal protein L22 [Quercus hypargyrea]YP_010251939.1 ribosomal protein L22 [Quercus schottkyana]YP_010305529.1 ribosomal protein L22 [Quercus glaucoides]YP_010305615.1 ribosomal protein L22 [Quercus hypargyrea]YP_010305701.1 ribosomal protein L22 [Quercus monim
MSANKAERVIEIDQICGRLYEERRMRLELMPYRVSYPILKLVYSAATNAIHNVGLNEASLIISKAEVVKGYYCEKIKTSSSRAQLSDKKTRFSYNYWIKRYICKGSIKKEV